MNPFATVMLVPLVAAICGIVFAFFTGRVPMSGRLAIALLCLPVLSILLFGAGWCPLFDWGLFGFSVPVSLAYSIHASRQAPNRRAALGGLAGSILLSLLYLGMIPVIAFQFVREVLGSH
jgi:hypothetical protein